MCDMSVLLSSHASLFLWWIGIVGWVSKPNVICSFRGGGRVHYYQYTQPNRKSASSKHALSGPQKTDSRLLMHYRPYS